MRRVPDAHFTARYAASTDPWSLRQRWYEERKRALTVAVLPRRRYGSAFEPGCATGLLTRELARRCDTVLATDVSPVAVAAARRYCRDLSGITIRVSAIPDHWPPDRFDLVVLSEVGYYLSSEALDAVIVGCDNSMVSGGHVVAVHYRPSAAEHLRDGDEVHEQLRAHPAWTLSASYTEAALHLDVFAVPGSAARAASGGNQERVGDRG